MNLNLLKLRIIELLEKHKKITTVAEILELKQPTVTFHMKNMERDFGVKLFDMRMGKIVLTDAGYALHHYAVRIGALAAEAQRAVTEFDTLRKGSLRIGASYVPATYLMPGVLRHFSNEHPNLHISLAVHSGPSIQAMLEQHEVDLGVLTIEPSASSQIDRHIVGEDDLVLIFAPNHPLASQPEPEADQIAAYPFILSGQDSSTRSLTEHWLDKYHCRLCSFLEIDSLEATKQTVMLGGHISFVSRMAVEWEVQQGLLQTRDIPGDLPKRLIYIATNKNRHRSALLQAFIDHLTLGVRTQP
ncbi:LysR substrate-binding domain-containing protein [Paenibacillus pinistramenti]|uniref:LysR substrate-binding domain-containing protein n=1 Tax=Paenibacillus pinistramenti TaxID=1768003 RepID=UPI001107F5BB|nr:LysR substrate-binding domain-containing protein [Paenibacillus pinistramenti]